MLQRPWAGRCHSGATFDNVLYVQFVFLVFCNKYLWQTLGWFGSFPRLRLTELGTAAIAHRMVSTSSHCVSGPQGALGVSNPQCPEQNFTVPWVWGRACAAVVALWLP